MSANQPASPPSSATFGQDASFRLDQPIGAMSISPSGRDVVLASKEGLHIIDLDSPWSPPRHLPHRTPWEVADVQWSPFATRDYWIVSTSNQKALVWNVGISGWRDAIEFVLHGHHRAITDINFSAHHPDILATCAVDTFVHAWDLRTPARPAFSFADWAAGATQVKWSRQDEHVVASTHDRFLHIWDRRKGAYPARTFEAHETKIYGIDWNRFEPTKIATCSLDKTIKLWNTNNSENTPEQIIETPFPVWRARHTPFGWGLLAMPQRGNGDLHLYDRRSLNGTPTGNTTSPAAVFHGHKGQVKEFLWRARGTITDGVDHRDFQLVTWGSDGELRLHSVSKNTLYAIGYEQGVSRPQRLNFTRRNARYRTFRDDIIEPYSPLDVPGRTDSNPSHHHSSLGVRSRQSTSIGMSKLSVAQFRGWLHGGKRERRTGMHGRNTVRQDMNPIAWMKNVKIESLGSNIDCLADEITQVGERFSKIEFESIDIRGRKAVMSLQGPWGANRAGVYTRVDFRFPRAYPKDAAAIITVYKTSQIDDEIHKMLSTEVQTISETHVSRQRGCIEAIIRYLLREQSMEQIVAWLLDESGADSKILSSADATDDMSSDSDDDNLNVNQDPSNSSANLRAPIAKACGALWSTTGELVCFFPHKAKEPASVVNRFAGTNLAESQTSRLFEGFGRLQTSSPARRPGTGTQPTVDDAASDISDVSSTFTTSSSSSSESEVGMRRGFVPYGSTTLNFGIRPRSRSADRSNKSTTFDGTKIDEEIRSNYFTIKHDVKALLPSNRTMAEQYRIFGPSPDICEHNQYVAAKAGFLDIASAWQLASLILCQSVPLEISKTLNSSQGNIAVIARQDPAQLRRKDSGIDLSFDDQSDFNILGNLRWGNNPLGSRYLVAAIFNYFEKRADIQSLAMFACVFSQFQDSSVHASRQKVHSSTPPQNSYQPSLEVADSLVRSKETANGRFTFAVTRPPTATKHDDIMALPALREPQHRRRNTASVAFRPELTHHEDGHRDTSIVVDPSSSSTALAKANAVSAGTSPEESRFNRRSNSGVAFAASRASLNALAQSFQHSPPSNNSTAGSSLKKFSPSTSGGWAGSLFGSTHNSRASRASQAPSEANSDEGANSNLRGSISLASLQDLRRDSRILRGSRGIIISPIKTRQVKNGDASNNKKRTMKISLHNQNQFDLDGHSDVPLLDPALKWKYRMYILAYADQLGAWGLFLQQAELFQFHGEGAEASLDWQRKNKTITPVPRLEITKCCLECGNTFAAIEKNGKPIGWHCTNILCHLSTERRSKRQVCSICQQVIHGLSIPCLQCGHLTCYACAQIWFGQPNHQDKDKDTSSQTSDADPPNPCPTGCGCICPSLTNITILLSASQAETQRQAQPQPQSQSQDVPSSPRTQPKAKPAPFRRQSSAMSTRSQRHKSEAAPSPAPPGPDTALGAMMALSRSRAASTTTMKNVAMLVAAPVSDAHQHEHQHEHEHGHGQGQGQGQNLDDLVPWSNTRVSSLGRGVGGGLSRGLSNKGSDSTIRRV